MRKSKTKVRSKRVVKIDWVLGNYLDDYAFDLTRNHAEKAANNYRAKGYYARIMKRQNGWKVMRSYNKRKFYQN